MGALLENGKEDGTLSAVSCQSPRKIRVVFKKLNKLKFLWNQRRIENKEASFASAPFSNNMALDLCNVEWACSWSLVMPAMFCKLRILPTKLFQLIMNGKIQNRQESRGKWQMAK